MTRPAFVIMGVSGCGKSSVGQAIAKAIDLTFIDGDDLHPAANIEKLRQGMPLEDHDRLPWLTEIARRLHPDTMIACSALRHTYRHHIREVAPAPVVFVYLRGKLETLMARTQARQGHFMQPAMLDSQLAVLEEPTVAECALLADIEAPLDKVVSLLTLQIKALYSGRTNWESIGLVCDQNSMAQMTLAIAPVESAPRP